MITKVISGGQIGVDIAALRAAHECLIETGGFAPLTYRSKAKDQVAHANSLRDFGLIERGTFEYPPRTFANVEAADATLILATKLTSPGERCTLKAIKKFHRPGFACAIHRDNKTLEWSVLTPLEEVVKWLEQIKPTVLNVAGTGDESVESAVEYYLVNLFNRYELNGRRSNERDRT